MNNSYNYWESLEHLKLYSLERRRERYLIIYTWKIIEKLVPIVPNISENDDRKITSYHTKRFGRKCVIPSVVGQSKYYQHFFAIIGPKLFYVMPQSIRDLSCCSVHVFKANLDSFLRSVTYKPIIPGYIGGNNALHGSNSLIDVLC